jgi:hypothetical protein
MSQPHDFIPLKRLPVVAPTCEKCGAIMGLTRLVLKPTGKQQFFECPVCDAVGKVVRPKG